MPRESRHVWVGNLPENVKEEEVAEYFSRYGRVEKIKLLPKISPDGGRAAFVDFVDIRSATKANEAQNQMGGRELRTNYNEPGNKQQHQNDFERNHAIMQHRIHGSYPPPGLGYQRPVVIYAAPPPQVDHVLHATSPYRHIYQRDDRRHQYQPRRGRSPGSRGSGSDADRSPSPGRRAGYSSGSDTNEKTDKCTVLVKNLYAKGTSDTSLEEALYHEFKKYGEILNINIKGNGMDRYAYVQFSKPEEAESGTRSNGKLFLGQEMKVTIKTSHQRSRSSTGAVIPMEDLAFDPHATRTVFVGNLDKGMMHGDLRNIFERFGEVVDVDIKKMQAGITTYAFVQFIDINSATLAKRKMDRQAVGNNRIKVGYGRGTPTNSLWVGNLPLKVTEHEISKYFQPFGYVQRVMIDKKIWQALVRFETIEACTKAFAEMHGQSFLGKRIAVDYASPACRNAFYNRMERHGLLDRRQLEPSPTPPDAHINFQNAARGGPFQPRFGNNVNREENRSERYSDRFERDGRDSRNRDRSRGYSPMTRNSLSPKRPGGPRESISPVRSDRNDSRKRTRSVGSPVLGQEPPKKKEKKKKKDKKEKNKKSKAGKGTMELGYNMNEEEPSPVVPKTKAELKKEKKEKKKAEKARKKAEKKEKKLKKLKNLQEKLTSIEAAVNSEGISVGENGVSQNNNEVRQDETTKEESQVSSNDDMATTKHSTTVEAVSEVSEGEGISQQTVLPAKSSDTLERVSEDTEDAKSPPAEDTKEVEENKTQDPPASPDEEVEDVATRSPEASEKKESKKIPTPPSNDSSSDSSSSSSSSSDSDDSDDSSDDDSKTSKHVARKSVKERDAAIIRSRSSTSEEKQQQQQQQPETARREPKAYRQDRGDPDPDHQRRDRSKEAEREREREREKEYSRTKHHEYYRSSSNKDRSPSGYRPRSRSRSPYRRDERSPYDRKRGRSPERRSPRYEQRKSSYDSRNEKYPPKDPPPPPPSKDNRKPAPSGVNPGAPPASQSTDTLMDLLRRFPVMWQGLLGLKNETAAVQMHFLSGDIRLAETSLPRGVQPQGVPPPLRISQRMKLEPSQLEGVDKRIKSPKEHCMLLALPCGRDPLDVHAQTRALKTGFITYLQQKQAAGIVNVPNPSTKQPVYVIHIFPPCEFAQAHLVRVAPDLLDSAVESGHLMVLITPI